ncbi:MAG: sulfate ABC transporter ATP-binding protein, partial [Pseudomonadota bacterium]
GQARRLADRVVFLLNGRVQETGAAAPFFDGPETEQAAAFLRGDIVE